MCKVVFGKLYSRVGGNRCKFRKFVGSYDGIMLKWKQNSFLDGRKIFSESGKKIVRFWVVFIIPKNFVNLHGVGICLAWVETGRLGLDRLV